METNEGQNQFLDDIQEWQEAWGKNSGDFFDSLTLETASSKKVRFCSMPEIRSIKQTYRNSELENLLERRNRKMWVEKVEKKDDGGLVLFVKAWVESNQETLKKLGIVEWQSLTPYKAIILANAIVNESVSYDPDYSEDDPSSGEKLDALSITELLTKGNAQCRHFAEATKTVFEVIKSFQKNGGLEGSYCTLIRSPKDKSQAPEADTAFHAYNMFVLANKDGDLNCVITDPTWVDRHYDVNSPQHWESEVDYGSRRLFGALKELKRIGVVKNESGQNDFKTREWLNGNFDERILLYLSYLRSNLKDYDDVDFQKYLKEFSEIFRQIKERCMPEKQILLYVSFGEYLNQDEKEYFNKILQSIDVSRFKDLLLEDQNLMKFFVLDTKSLFDASSAKSFINGFNSFHILKTLEIVKRLYLETAVSKGGFIEVALNTFIKNLSREISRLHTALQKFTISADPSLLKSQIIYTLADNPLLEIKSNIVSALNIITGCEEVVQVVELKNMIGECIKMMDEISNDWVSNKEKISFEEGFAL